MGLSLLSLIIMYMRYVFVDECDNRFYMLTAISFSVVCTFHSVICPIVNEHLVINIYFGTHIYVLL